MKKRSTLIAGIAGLFLFAFAASSFADDKPMTISGEGKCAKCILKEGDKCQTVIETKEDGKTVKYYIADNEVGKKFNDKDEVCEQAKPVTATGTVKEVDGKKVLTPTKIKVVKKS